MNSGTGVLKAPRKESILENAIARLRQTRDFLDARQSELVEIEQRHFGAKPAPDTKAIPPDVESNPPTTRELDRIVGDLYARAEEMRTVISHLEEL